MIRPRGGTRPSDDPAGPRTRELNRRTAAAHAAAGTRLHEGKRVRDSPGACVWGGEFRGTVLGGELDSLVQVGLLTLVFLCGRTAHHWTASRLVSSWVHHFSYTKSALCLFDAVFK